ncbi:hypothetical protein Pedsa_0501 [Pseudopedobacter saltans DSM 12145]|uniref:Uncharacterized protein n=1 Tax=Pseudopedobacter saltans (strain ATCC 51119 / DSM 12145 / JCM 21818 / CCUG 39354 / LMG 10337 / NBRC 100064 / NCIMB 13643) TaxID=762903 RepID=F0S6K6_PSESL|nr:hypothetical protein [Pseudopedobacter saltans]ADY51082.1 hypothetical protein Pedsa_0501 [Pseudopedobacter saltans DSM 12145]
MNLKNVLLAFILLFGIKCAEAQVSVNVNIGTQPLWGPVGYQHVDYYYLPEIETYYYVPKRQFIYINGGNWVFSSSLPYRHRHYNLYGGHKVVINQPYAYKHHKHYKVKYAQFHGPYQPVLRDHRHASYHRQPVYVKQHKGGNGHGNKHHGHHKHKGKGHKH